jgi:hypothetical protein
MKRSATLNLPSISLYSFENFLNVYRDNDSNYNFYNLLRSINVFPSNNEEAEMQYTIAYSDTWASISYKNYNTLDLWWLVCAYNNIIDPTKIPAPGTTLKILKSQYVGQVIAALIKQINS